MQSPKILALEVIILVSEYKKKLKGAIGKDFLVPAGTIDAYVNLVNEYHERIMEKQAAVNTFLLRSTLKNELAEAVSFTLWIKRRLDMALRLAAEDSGYR